MEEECKSCRVEESSPVVAAGCEDDGALLLCGLVVPAPGVVAILVHKGAGAVVHGCKGALGGAESSKERNPPKGGLEERKW